MFLTNPAAAADPAVQMAMASYAKRLQAEEQHRQMVRQGKAPAGQSGNWHISDRH